jgi:flagellin
MAMLINTNIPSLNAQHNLSASQGQLQTALQRLSSGLRINSAKDDAAGLSIAERMTAQIRGTNQAARNANDAISLSQTAEGALGQVTANLQRIRELAVQSANGSNSVSDRNALNAEASSLVAEIDRVATTTQFNGVNLLDGSFTSQQFQVGSNAGQTIAITSISSARSSALGVGAVTSYSTSITNPGVVGGLGLATAGALTLNGVAVGASATDGVSSANATGSAIAIANAINAVSGSSGVTATAQATTKHIAGLADSSTASIAGLTVNGVSIGTVTIETTAATSAAITASNLAAAINSVTSTTGVTATITAGTGSVDLTAADGRNITLADTGVSSATELASLQMTAATTTGKVYLESSSANGITIGGTAAAMTATGFTAGYTAAGTTTSSGVSAVDLTTITGSNTAIGVIDAALTAVNNSRASLGAYQNRFGSAVTTLQTTAENLSAARSRIQDADFASETAALTRGQILQQAGVAMLAQANSLPNTVLSLLRG